MEWLSPDAKIYTVDEITTYIKNLLSRNTILNNLQIKGEISNFTHHSNGHMYFKLKDEESIISCAMFKRVNGELNFKPKEGVEVIIKGRIDVYKVKGNYQIIVEEMQLAGEGALYLKFLELKKKLEKEGLFKEEHKKPIPKYPRKIGIISSPQGAAIRDIIKTTKKRFPHVHLILYPTLVQGPEAKYSIERGIEILNSIKPDVIIISRGGGSIEDLWSFNEENVARAIFKSKIPIITGIGHEIDFTIADFVADIRAHTPTAAAETALPNIFEINNLLSNLKNRLKRDFIRIYENYQQRLINVSSRAVFIKPQVLIQEYIQLLDEKETQIIRIIKNKNEFLKKDVGSLLEKLNALSPKSILRRGYSITMKGSKIIKSVKEINKKEVMSTTLSDGKVISRVE